MADKEKDGRGPVRRSQVYRVLDDLAERVRKQSENGRCNAAAGGDIHKAYMEWRKTNPDTLEEFERSHRDVRDWDAASRPKIDTHKGQGILAYYSPRALVPLDESGTRKLLGELTREDLDAWWLVQEAEKRAQDIAFNLKKEFKTSVRRHLKKPKQTVDEIMRQMFGFQDEA